MVENIEISDLRSKPQSIKTVENARGVETIATVVDAAPAQNVDAFSRFRVSTPAYRFDSQLTYRIDTDLWDVKTTNGTVTHDATERLATLSADASGVNSAILQSHYHAPYTPGRSQLIFCTFVMGAAPATAGYKRAGYFDGSNGIYLERLSGAVNLVCKSSTAHGTETVAQADWNVDPMDGTGPSGITLNLLNCQILVIQMQALYVGQVLIGFDVDGNLVPAHAFQCSNKEALPYIAQASLPIRYEVGGTAATGTPTTMKAVCSSVISEGGRELDEIPGRNFVSTGTIANTATAVLTAIRCKAQLNSINQNAVVIPTELEITIADAGAWVSILINPTISAGTFTDVSTSSVIEESFAGNAGTDPTISANGTVIDRFYVGASAANRNEKTAGIGGKVVMAYSHLLAAGDVMAVLVEGGATTDAFGTLKWKEIR